MGSSPDVAVNHWPQAIAIHRANHPETMHYIEDVFDVDPVEAAAGRPVGFLWMSPTCSHFSRAKGRALRDERIRAQAWIIRPWIEKTRPEVIVLENVVEFETWGPLIDHHEDGCPGGADGEGCWDACGYGRPDKARAGETYCEWRDWITSQGYSFEARRLVAWEYGAPTTRERLYIIMRADGQSARWPAPTHAPEPTSERPHRWRTAAEVIDWSIPCRSIFGRKKSLARATLSRLVRGTGKFVLESDRPFLLRDGVPLGDVGGTGSEGVEAAAYLVKHFSERRPGEVMGQPMDRPMGTVTARDHHSLAVASLVKFYGTSTGAPLDRPLGAVTAQGMKHGLSVAYLSRYNGCSVGQSPGSPLGTLDTRDRYSLVRAELVDLAVLPSGSAASLGRAELVDPAVLPSGSAASLGAAELCDFPGLDEVTARRARRVYDLMVEHGYQGPGLDHDLRIAFVRVDGAMYVVVDLAMRMLVPRELFRAQGFPDSYVIDPVGPTGRPLSGRDQVRACGNSVCPPVARAIVASVLGSDLIAA